MKTKHKLNQIYVDRTGQPLKRSNAIRIRDNFMSAEEAKDYGLIDQVITRIDSNNKGVIRCLNLMMKKAN